MADSLLTILKQTILKNGKNSFTCRFL